MDDSQLAALAPTVGQIWRDRDKRMFSGNRRCEIIAIDGDKAFLRLVGSSTRGTRVSLKNLRKRWELVKQPWSLAKGSEG